MTEKDLLTLFRIVVVLEHLIEHKVEKFLICNEKLNEFLTFNLRELFDFLRRTCFDDTEVGLEKVRLACLVLTNAVESRSRLVELLHLIVTLWLLLKLHLDELLSQSLSVGMDAVDKDVR